LVVAVLVLVLMLVMLLLLQQHTQVDSTWIS